MKYLGILSNILSETDSEEMEDFQLLLFFSKNHIGFFSYSEELSFFSKNDRKIITSRLQIDLLRIFSIRIPLLFEDESWPRALFGLKFLIISNHLVSDVH